MKVAVDCQSTEGRRTGIGSFASALMEALEKEAPDIGFLRYTSGAQRDLNTPARIAWESARIPLRARRDGADLIYSPGFAPAFFSPMPQVVTVHDLIGMVFPANQRPAARFYWSRWLPLCLKRARRLVASSRATQADIARFLGIPPDRAEVVPLFAESCYQPVGDESAIRRVLAKYSVRGPFFIGVSTLEPRKNFLRLLEAYRRVREEKKDAFRLFIAGKEGDGGPALRDFVRRHGLEDGVLMPGYVPKEDIVCLYSAALGFVSVSLYEGFGLPALEAMSCGISGVASDRSSLPEVAADAALAANPEDVDSIAAALISYASNPSLRRTLGEKALRRSKEFSAERTAGRMAAIFREVLAEARRR